MSDGGYANFEQCTCGILFSQPMHEDVRFMEHVTDKTHERCLEIEICGPCYAGFCKECEKVRRSDVQRWKCRCMHDLSTGHRSTATALSASATWSNWLEAGRPSGVSLGIEEPA